MIYVNKTMIGNMMNKILAAILMTLSFSAAAQSTLPDLPTANKFLRADWSTDDTVRETVFVGLQIIDYKQTLDIKNHPGYSETNMFMGKHPSDVRIRNHFIISTALNIAVARVLPAGWPRQTLQYGTIAAEVFMIAKNRRIGINCNF